MSSLEELNQSLESFQAIPFPPMPSGRTLGEINTTALWAETTSVIHSGLLMNGRIGSRQKNQLQNCAKSLLDLEEKLETEDQRAFFGALMKLCEQAIDSFELV